MDDALRQAIAEVTRDDALAEAIAQLSNEDRAAFAGRLRVLLVAEQSEDAGHDVPPIQSVVIRCRDRGCRGVVARAAGSTMQFVSLEKSVDRDSVNEMSIVENSITIDEVLDSGGSTIAYCPRCWVRYRLDDVSREVRTAQLLGLTRRAMPVESW
jgi:hypothetical protein